MPMRSSAWSTLTTAMIHNGTLRELGSGIAFPLCRPAPLGAAGDVVERTPAFVGRRPCFLNGAANVRQLADEIVEPGFDLGADPRSVLGQIQPAPQPAGDRSHHGRQQYTRSFFHVAL